MGESIVISLQLVKSFRKLIHYNFSFLLQLNDLSEDFFTHRKVTVRKSVTDSIFYALFTKPQLIIYVFFNPSFPKLI